MFFFAFLSFAACDGASSEPDDTGTTPAPGGLPSGSSAWSGTGEYSGLLFRFSLALENDGGDLTGEVTVTEDPSNEVGFGTGIYSVTGTHEPGSGLVAIAPEDWIQEPDLTGELLGFIGAYDPDADTLVGTIADYASDAENYLTGGETTLTHDSGDGAPIGYGAMDKALPVGTRSFSGTQRCTSEEREMEGEMTYDGAGAVSGTISFGDYTFADGTHTFAFTGVHNPSTGGITLVPGLYTATTDQSFMTFFVEATYDPATDRFDGEGRVNTGSCPDDYWQAGF